jgi:hypothetical protein
MWHEMATVGKNSKLRGLLRLGQPRSAIYPNQVEESAGRCADGGTKVGSFAGSELVV